LHCCNVNVGAANALTRAVRNVIVAMHLVIRFTMNSSNDQEICARLLGSRSVLLKTNAIA
jgi:hypothetical protein